MSKTKPPYAKADRSWVHQLEAVEALMRKFRGGSAFTSMPVSKDKLADGIGELSLSTKASRKSPKQEEVLDSWEDEESDDDNDHGIDDLTQLSPPRVVQRSSGTLESSQHSPPSSAGAASEVVFAPDGTPLSPQPPRGTNPPPNTPNLGADGSAKRPEKTTGPAARMIAGALGVRAPKKTEEQRQYERAMKEKEIKQRNEERERREREERQRERQKQEAWDG